MSCNRPVVAYYSDKLNESGKRSLVFNQNQRYQGGDVNYTQPIEIACGKCLGCKADQSLMWSIRSYHESTLHDQNCFLTLTYDDAHLPQDGKIDKRHLQNFFKRIRRDGTKIRYIACGEYGGKTNRPHYHAIIFGKDWLEKSVPLKQDLYTNQSLMETWGHGIVSIAPVTMGSICYVCGYVTKKIADPDTFNLMSRRPGIGHTWLDLYSDDIARTGVVTIEGRSYQVPKRYLLWQEEELASVKKERKDYAIKMQKKHDSLGRFKAGIARERALQAKSIEKSRQEKI